VVQKGICELQSIFTELPSEQVFDRLAVELRIELLNSVISWLNACQHKFDGVNSS
jgi:hypothetical protein